MNAILMILLALVFLLIAAVIGALCFAVMYAKPDLDQSKAINIDAMPRDE